MKNGDYEIMNELEFLNLTVLYNDKTKEMKKTRTMERCCTFVSVIVIIGSLLLFVFYENLLIGLMVSLTTVILSIIALISFMNKIEPPHYEFLSWLRHMKRNEIEIGWFNDRYVVQILSEQHGWCTRDLECFLRNEPYVLIDKSKKGEPVHITIDMTQDLTSVIVKNK
jgi:hypothetical protein